MLLLGAPVARQSIGIKPFFNAILLLGLFSSLPVVASHLLSAKLIKRPQQYVIAANREAMTEADAKA